MNRYLIAEIQRSPLLGAGFGQEISLRYHSTDSHDVDPHNSFVAIAYRMGVPAAICLFLAILLISRRAGQVVRRQDMLQASYLLACLGSFVSLCVFAAFNVVLEGPYMGIFFWLFLGLLLRFSAHPDRSERNGSGPPAPATVLLP